MSRQYDEYLKKHKQNVTQAFEWICSNLPHLVEGMPILERQIIFDHDHSKSDPDEYKAYDVYFYGGNRSYSVAQDFNKAWLNHIHRNPHHWQYWILINGDPNEGEIILEMPQIYILEMICDWWSFSWEKGKLDEVFAWYSDHKDYIRFHNQTRQKVEDILAQIKGELERNRNE